MAAGSIVVDLLMRTGSFETDTKRAEATAKKRADAIGKAFEDMGQKIGIAAGIAATALTAMVYQTTQQAEDITNLARISGATTEEFQRMAAAAKTVGVDAEKLSSIYKDLNDRLGDFAATGGGEMKDFFEQIAPKVGITVESFRQLTGPQALQLVVSSLEKAGVSSQEMTFYLEALADNAVMLAPLLQDGGKAAAQLGDDAQKAGRILNDEALAAAKALSYQIQEMQGLLGAASNRIVTELAPALITLGKEFTEASKDGSKVDAVAKGIASAFEYASAAGMGVAFVIESVGNALGGLVAAASFAVDNQWGKAASTLGAIGDDTSEMALRYSASIDKIINARQKLAGVTGLPEMPAIGDTRGNRPYTTPNKKPEKSAAPKAAKAAKEEAGPFVGPLPDESVMTRYLELEREALSLKESLMTADEKRAAQLATWQEMMDHGLLTQEQFNQLSKEPVEEGYWEQWLESAELAMQNFDELANNVIKNFTSGFGNAFEQMIFDSKDLGDAMRDFAEGMLRSFVNAVGQMIAQWLAFKAIQSATGGGLGGIVRSFFGGGFAQGGPVLNDRAYLVGERGPEIFVPNTAGSIIPNNQAGAGGNVTVNLIEDKGRAGKTESRMNNGAQELDVFVADIMGDGPRSKAIRQAFGLQRRGY